MRSIQVLVTEENLDRVTAMLEDEELDYVRQRVWHDGERKWRLEVPVPTDAIGYVLERLTEAGVDRDEFTTIGSLESAMTPRSEALQDRFADDFDPLTRPELRSKARDIARDRRSYLAMVFLSAIIAVAGLLIESAAVVVGSMVIAPLVGPVLTAAVGAVTTDREMFLRSVWLQAAGLAIALAGAVAFGFVLRWSGFFPATLDVTAIDLIALRIAPNFVTIAVGAAAGAAGAYGLMTKGPTSLIGVMIAAALIPAAGSVGIATAWGRYRLAVGSLLLLVLSLLLINVGAYVVLRRYYHPTTEDWLGDTDGSRRRVVVGTIVALVLVGGVVGVTTVQQLTFERAVNEEVEDLLSDPDYEHLEAVTTQTQYAGPAPGAPPTVGVVLSRPADAPNRTGLADELDRRITERTGRSVSVEVRFDEFRRSDANGRRSPRPVAAQIPG